MYENATPMILVDDVDEAVAWYQHILGATLRYTLPKSPPFQWCSLLLGNMEIMISQKAAARDWYSSNVSISTVPTNIIIYIYVTSILDLYNEIKETTKIVLELIEQPYGLYEFAIQDPFGFILVFAQVME